MGKIGQGGEEYNIQFSGAGGIIYAPQDDPDANYSGFDMRNRDEIMVKVMNGTKSGVVATLYGATFDDEDMKEEASFSDALSGLTVDGNSGVTTVHSDLNYAYARMLVSGTVAGESGVITVVFQPNNYGRSR